jgi:hypothetical protein
MAIKINHLRFGVTPTLGEKIRRVGATRFRPAFDALEALNLMHAGTGGASMAAVAQVAHVQAAGSTEQEEIRQKLAQIQQVVAVLQQMDVPKLSTAQWLVGQLQKNQLLMEADQTELLLKQSEIRKLESEPGKAKILADEAVELAIMTDKLAKMTQLQTALEQASEEQPGAELCVAVLTSAISHDELRLKNQQVATLRDQIRKSEPKKQPALIKLLKGEQYEVQELKRIDALNREIVAQVESGTDAARLAELRRQVVQHELLMKQQNERQLEARLKS